MKELTQRELAEKAVKICEQNAELFKALNISDFDSAYTAAKKALYAIKLQEDYGISTVKGCMVRYAEPNVYVPIEEHIYIASMGEKYNRKISWSVDGRQPEDEVMLVITFPTGAYIFGDSYPRELFDELWEEIKTYDYKFVDDVNHNIYFPLEKAAPIANEFRGILKKYFDRFCAEANTRKIAKLKRELATLEGEAQP